MPIFSTRSSNNLKGIHPRLVRVLNAAIKTTPVDFIIVEGVRSLSRQQQLYAQGRTKPGPVVTYADGIKSRSNHQVHKDGYGYAVDLYPFINGRVELNADKELKIIAAHIKQTAAGMDIKITWGGDWKRPFDPPHFELMEEG
ncbi:hypothetical protein A8C56_07930 [Niabella ginsenosidivorans]|uniref:Peptidase M15C domain-containing protein n=1 Tax=Niabella ginsenosidivorans TaxID=1176587 RepID=A0A1A9HZU7_9BACT|nr:M15 family metallopeptidase [Niabella ginsenosidivorans]ANH80918.1 hypothetical protein A8C56_07930 [Niabella ginsenosidivorans]